MQEIVLLYPEHAVVLAFRRFRGFAVDVADCAVPDAFPFALDTQLFQQRLIFGPLELFLRAVNPDAAKAQRMRRQQLPSPTA